MKYLEWLSQTGRLPRRGKLLDIGESCLLGATPDELRTVLRRHGCLVPDAELAPFLDRFAYRSTLIGDPNTPTLFLSEVLELTEVEYVAFDVVAARKAERFDLNVHTLAAARHGWFDIVINFGTTEHLLNQFNAFRVMHDAVRPGGYIFHQVPFTGFLRHGYFCYTPMLFRDLARANGYELADLWFSGPMGAGHPIASADGHPTMRDGTKPQNDIVGQRVTAVPDNLINVLYRKPVTDLLKADTGFRLSLEVSTAAGRLDTSAGYTSPYIHSEPPSPGRPELAPATTPGLLRRVIGDSGTRAA